MSVSSLFFEESVDMVLLRVLKRDTFTIETRAWTLTPYYRF